MRRRVVYQTGSSWVIKSERGYYAHCLFDSMGPIKNKRRAEEAADKLSGIYELDVPKPELEKIRRKLLEEYGLK